MDKLEKLLARKIRMERELIALRTEIARAQREHSVAFRKARLAGKIPGRVQHIASAALREAGLDQPFFSDATDHPEAARLVAEKGRLWVKTSPNAGRATLADVENWLESQGESFRF